MDRRSFFKFLGLGTVAAVTVPTALVVEPKKRRWFAPRKPKENLKSILPESVRRAKKSERPDPLFATPQELHQYTLEQQWKRLSGGKPVELMPKLAPFVPIYSIEGKNIEAYPHLLSYVQLNGTRGGAIYPGQAVCVTGGQRLQRSELDA